MKQLLSYDSTSNIQKRFQKSSSEIQLVEFLISIREIYNSTNISKLRPYFKINY